ncbi:MAG: hypothetical protein IJ064_00725 [Bacteroidaceae bacterium]|nr:hypothetical protein [Bacteroidaceae bacterium]
MNIAIYTLTSQLHDEEAVAASTREFLSSLGIEYEMKGADYADYGQSVLSLIYVRTGGTEGIFKTLLPQLQKAGGPFYLLTSGTSNSLAASMEILSYLRQQGLQGEILHGTAEYVRRRIDVLERVALAKRQLRGARLGIIGQPSDWLISSHADRDEVRRRLGIELIDIPMDEVLQALPGEVEAGLPGAEKIYEALKRVTEDNRLQGFTIRCFDLLSAVHNTGCLALARLNSQGLRVGEQSSGMGLVAGCEGDVPAMLSMMIVRSLTGVSGFQANPARIDPEQGEMTLAHCTIPLDMVERYELDTHFESGIGVGIRGYMREGDVTLFKVSGDLRRHFVAEGTLLRNEARPNLCRTQQVIRLDDPSLMQYFLTDPIGNHHIVVPGHVKALLTEILK